jgi:hypothetical protein
MSFVSWVVKWPFCPVFNIITAWEGKGVITLRWFRSLEVSLFLKHVNKIRERYLELKQLRLKFFEIKLISAINGTSHLRFREKQETATIRQNNINELS